MSRKDVLEFLNRDRKVDDKFIVGYGLDYCGLYRNLDYVGYFE